MWTESFIFGEIRFTRTTTRIRIPHVYTSAHMSENDSNKINFDETNKTTWKVLR